ncbi:hypothetical protein NPIL_240151 [Nephila pilipes]|uniref:Uncharacterized protein n=1 Tax=Nephila pilipes TaxID=299642 RepID=A0A8X6IKP5_NEPPI|nr:hypothetical protein NPIL_240151 [Nephila pilipes]
MEHVVDICSVGAAPMVGKMREAVSRVMKEGNATSSHCVNHWHFLVITRFPKNLKLVLDGAVKIINPVKPPVSTFKTYHRRSRNTQLPFLAARRERLHTQVVTFTKKPFLQQLTDVEWLLALGYLSHIFGKLNETSTFLQGNEGAQSEKVKVLREIIVYLKACVNSRDISNFPRNYYAFSDLPLH